MFSVSRHNCSYVLCIDFTSIISMPSFRFLLTATYNQWNECDIVVRLTKGIYIDTQNSITKDKPIDYLVLFYTLLFFEGVRMKRYCYNNSVFSIFHIALYLFCLPLIISLPLYSLILYGNCSSLISTSFIVSLPLTK